MTDPTPASPQPGLDRLFRLALVLALAILIGRAVMAVVSPVHPLAAAGNDDIMRLVSARDWLAGQGWFDMTQYRMLPETGLSLHWSRYIDLGIGSLIAGFSLIASQPMAEALAAVLWPCLLGAALIVSVGYTTRNLLGPAAAAIAVLMVICYPPLALGYFGPGKLDHHNAQILAMTIAALSLVVTDRTALAGTVAGLAAALSLAIGLEALFMVAAVSILHVTDAAFGRAGARPRLLAYCVAITGGATVLFIGQTPRAEWGVAHCDELAPPILALVGLGAISALAGWALPARLRGPFPMLGVVALVLGAGVAMAWPLLSPCLQAPYANLSAETQTFIATQILEALPLTRLWGTDPLLAASYFGIPVVVLTCGTVLWAYQSRQGARQSAIGHLLLIGWLGLLASFWQMRQVVVLATVIPLLSGYLVAPVLHWRMTARTGRSQLALYAVGAATLFQPLLVVLIKGATLAPPAMAAGAPDAVWTAAVTQDEACYDLDQLAALNHLPPTTLLTGTNIGPRLIMVTHHTGLAAPYHRSEAALTNGRSFEMEDADAFAAVLDEIGADLFMLCKGSTYGSPTSVGSRLAAGAAIAQFAAVATGTEDILVFRKGGRE